MDDDYVLSDNKKPLNMKCTLNNLLSLFSNVLVRYFLLGKIKHKSQIDNVFLNPKYSVSKIFKNFLFYNAIIINETVFMRIQLNQFILTKNLIHTKQFLQEKNIPDIFDIMNEYNSMLNLTHLSLKNNILS